MAQRTQYKCSNCDATYPTWLGICRKCGEQGTVDEVKATPAASDNTANMKPAAADRLHKATTGNAPTRVTEITAQKVKDRLKTGIGEFDRVLGGGIVAGCAMLLAGPPGSGKSSILGAVSQGIAEQGKVVLYVSGEENKEQIASRNKRIHAMHENNYIMSESNADKAEEAIYELKPDLVIVDSIQTLLTSTSDGRIGSPSQVTEVANLFTSLAKRLNIPVLMIGHITKAGEIGGPKTVEHLVDVVLYLESSSDSPLRMLRGAKNRYASTDEIGIFEHTEDGLMEISDPSGFFTNTHAPGISGYATSVTVEGLRAIPVEVQALVTPSPLPNPRKLSTGVVHARSLMIQAILEKYAGLKIGDKDVYVATAAGISIDDSSIDLAIAAAIVSSCLDVPPAESSVYIGELSLTGEVRQARHSDRRVREARRLGFENVIDHTAVKTVGDLVRQVKKNLKGKDE
jgi:DNA repair protein RadA/Sms